VSLLSKWKVRALRAAWSIRIAGYPVALAGAALACACSQPSGQAKDDLATIKRRVLHGEAALVDVREPAEWERGHVAGAILLPTKAISAAHGDQDQARLAELLAGLPKDKPLYCYCVKGVRALAVARILQERGYQAQGLKPGFAELAEAGFPVGDSQPKRQ
jgi:rhodanese-related sulfurtransferase